MIDESSVCRQENQNINDDKESDDNTVCDPFSVIFIIIVVNVKILISAALRIHRMYFREKQKQYF